MQRSNNNQDTPSPALYHLLQTFQWTVRTLSVTAKTMIIVTGCSASLFLLRLAIMGIDPVCR